LKMACCVKYFGSSAFLPSHKYEIANRIFGVENGSIDINCETACSYNKSIWEGQILPMNLLYYQHK